MTAKYLKEIVEFLCSIGMTKCKWMVYRDHVTPFWAYVKPGQPQVDMDLEDAVKLWTEHARLWIVAKAVNDGWQIEGIRGGVYVFILSQTRPATPEHGGDGVTLLEAIYKAARRGPRPAEIRPSEVS